MTIGDVKSAIESWRRSFLRDAVADSGRSLLNRWPESSAAECAEEEVELFLTNLSFCLLEHRVPLWAPDGHLVPMEAWERLRAMLRGNRYGEDRRRYVVSFLGLREGGLSLGVSSLSSRPAQLRIGDVYAAMPFTGFVVRDRQRAWTRHAASRSARRVVEDLCSEQALALETSFEGRDLRVTVRLDPTLLPEGERLEACAEAVAAALSRQDFLCGEPTLLAGNAARVPLARRRRMKDALFLIPDRSHGATDELLLLPTPRVLQDYSVVVVPGPVGRMAAVAERAGVQLLSLDELLLDDNRERLRVAARSLPD